MRTFYIVITWRRLLFKKLIISVKFTVTLWYKLLIIRHKFLFKSGSYNKINCITIFISRGVVVKPLKINHFYTKNHHPSFVSHSQIGTNNTYKMQVEYLASTDNMHIWYNYHPSSQVCLLCEVQACSSVGKEQFLRSRKQTPFRHRFPSPALDLSFLPCTSRASQASLKDGEDYCLRQEK